MRARQFTFKARLLSMAFAAAVAVPAAGQIAGGLTETTRTDLGGRNYIAGAVYAPDGLPVQTRMRIRLSSLNSREVITTTDDTGKFVFSGLGNGYYQVFVDAEGDFQTAMEQVEIALPRGTPPQAYSIVLRLNYKKSSLGRPGVVRTDLAGVPKKAVKRSNKAMEYAAGGKSAEAITELKAALVEHPQFVLALVELGVQYFRLGQLDVAETELGKAVSLKPDSYQALVNYGIVLFRSVKLTEAEQQLQAALKVKPDSPVANYFLGRVMLATGRPAEGEPYFRKAVETDAKQVREAHRMLAAIYLARGDHTRTLAELEAYLLLNPKAPDAEKLKLAVEELRKLVASAKVQKQQ